MILPVALPFVVVKNRIIEPVDSGIYLKFLIIFQMGIENKSDIRSNAISFMYNAFPIQGTKIASTTSDRIDIGKYFPFFCLKIRFGSQNGGNFPTKIWQKYKIFQKFTQLSGQPHQNFY